jgi:hypothetical protein
MKDLLIAYLLVQDDLFESMLDHLAIRIFIVAGSWFLPQSGASHRRELEEVTHENNHG